MTGHIYLFFEEHTGLTKIGMSSSYEGRFQALYRSKRPIKCHGVFETNQMRQDEAAIHELLGEKRVRGEWFLLNGDDVERVARYFNAPENWRDLVPNLNIGRLRYEPPPSDAGGWVDTPNVQRVEIKVWECGCERCGHEWETRTDKLPGTCPRCKSPHWNKPKRETKSSSSPDRA